MHGNANEHRNKEGYMIFNYQLLNNIYSSEYCSLRLIAV